VVQVMCSSQAISKAMLFGKKTLSVASTNALVRSCHFGSWVCGEGENGHIKI
jgi:hypothetical protein